MKDSRTPLYELSVNKGTLLLRTVLLVPTLNIFSKFNPLNTDTQLINTDTFCGPVSVRVNEVGPQLVDESTGYNYENRQTSKLKTTVL